MPERDSLQPVRGRPPRPHIAAGFAAAPGRAGDEQRGALAGRGRAPKVDAAALGVAGPDQTSGEGARQGKGDPTVADAVGRHLLLPFLEGPALPEGVLDGAAPL